MSHTPVPHESGTPEPRSDAELIGRIRAGDVDGHAATELFERHWAAVRRAALGVVGPSEADDVAQEAMVRVFEAVEGGGGPDSAFRAYAAATARNVAVSWRRGHRPDPAGSAAELDALAPLEQHRRDAQESVVDRDLLARSFAQVPERYRTVLWHTVVEGRSPADLMHQYGTSANCVAVTAARARESLRRAWLTVHLTTPDAGPDCERHLRLLIRLRRGETVPPATRDSLEQHLDACERCQSAAEALEVLVRRLPAALVPPAALAGPGAISAPGAAGPMGATGVTGTSVAAPLQVATTLSLKAKAVLTVGGLALVASGIAGVLQAFQDDATPVPVATASQSPAPRDVPPAAVLSPSPTASPDEVAPPTVLTVEDEPAWLVPRLGGTGIPGAAVVATDGDGGEVGRAAVDARGTWTLTPADLSVGTHELAVIQVLDGRRSAPAERTFDMHLDGPSLSIDHCGPAPDGGGWIIAVRGVPGRHVHAAVDGTGAEAFVIPPDGLLRAVWPDLGAGTHAIAVWYADPVTGRMGGVRTTTADLIAP